MHNTRLKAVILPFLLLAVLLMPVLHGCSAKKPTGEVPEHTPVTLSLPVQEGDAVLVRASGSKVEGCDDFATVVSMSLQSELGIRAVKKEQDADVIIDIRIYDIYLAESTPENEASGSDVLLSTAVGTGLGMLGGGLVSGTRTGALVGSGIGAAVGLGVSLQQGTSFDIWAMDADISCRFYDGSDNSQEYRTSVAGRNMERKAAIDALGARLARDLVRAMRSR